MHLAITICLVFLDNLYMYTTLFFENILIDLYTLFLERKHPRILYRKQNRNGFPRINRIC